MKKGKEIVIIKEDKNNIQKYWQFIVETKVNSKNKKHEKKE